MTKERVAIPPAQPSSAKPSAGPTLSHEELRKRAVQWLTNTKRCGVVLSEIVTGCSEIPDAIGWRGHTSYIVECKTSRSDFRANKTKIHARCNRGVGQFRYIMVPRCLTDQVLKSEAPVRPEDLEGSDYGLLWCSAESGTVRVMKEATVREQCQDDEITMLVSALRRVRAREFLILVQETQQDSRADAAPRSGGDGSIGGVERAPRTTEQPAPAPSQENA
jgi:hypothetical protein